MACLLLISAAAAVVVPVLLNLPARPATQFSAAGMKPSGLRAYDLPSGTVDVNTADLYELTELPGIGETLAQNLMDEREANGPFLLPEDLLYVKGIGKKKLAGFRELLDFSSQAEQLLIHTDEAEE